MDFEFLDRRFIDAARDAVRGFREAVEQGKPTEDELCDLVQSARHYGHCNQLDEEFLIGSVDGSGEYPVFQQDDIFLHFAVAAATLYETHSTRQHKLSVRSLPNDVFKRFAILRDDAPFVVQSYRGFLDGLVGLSLKELVQGSDYCSVFSDFGRRSIGTAHVSWGQFAFSKASEVATHAYQLRSLAELGMAIRLLEFQPKYILLDTSLVYFLLGESLYLPEVLKRHLITEANRRGIAVVALCKSHNIPNGDLIGRRIAEEREIKEHWYLRLPAESLGESALPFLRDREIPPKLGVSYLFKFHGTSFPMRLDVDAEWWKQNIGGEAQREERFFRELDFTCHDVRSYGYPYPMHAAHRRSRLTRRERKAAREVLLQFAQEEGILRGAAFAPDPEAVHMGGV